MLRVGVLCVCVYGSVLVWCVCVCGGLCWFLGLCSGAPKGGPLKGGRRAGGGAKKGGAKGGSKPRKVGPRGVGPRRVGAQNFALFFPSPATIFFLSSLSWGSFRGILV